MRRLYIPLFLFLLLILEGVAIDLLPAIFVKSDLLIVPHWVFVFLVMATIFYDKETTYYSILYGVIFGLLIDVVYTEVLGVYMFTYAIVVYIIHGLIKILHANFFVLILLGIIGIIMVDAIIYLIYSVIGLADMSVKGFFIYRMIPTLAANLVFLLFLYPLFKNRLLIWRNEQLHSRDRI